MQVSHLIKVLSTMNPNDHVALKWYLKDEFDMNLDRNLSKSSWKIICDEFESDENIEQMNLDYLMGEAYAAE